jgi:general secretion pathway protein L
MSRFAAVFAAYVDELAGFLEEKGIGKPKRPSFAVVQEGGRFSCYRIEGRAPVLVADGDWDRIAEAPLPRSAKAQAVELRLDQRLAVIKTLQLPDANRSFVDAIVRHQIERLTPWTAETVAYDYSHGEKDKGGVSVRVVAAARERVDAAVQALAKAGLTAGVVGVSSDPLDKASPVDLLHQQHTARSTRLRRMAAGILVGLLVVAGAASLSSGLVAWRLSTEAAQLRADVAAARAQVQSLADTTVQTGFSGMLLRKLVARPMVLVLENLSTELPAHTYLTSLSVRDDVVRIGGLSEDAPALIQLLEGTDLLSEVRFASATMRDMVSGRDRFEIDGKLSAAQTEDGR